MNRPSRLCSSRKKRGPSSCASRCSNRRWCRRRSRSSPTPSWPATRSTTNGVPEVPDLNELMRMAQEAQNKLMQAQEDLDKVEVEGVAGGGMVRVRASAKGRVIGVEIDQSLLAPTEKQMVEDLVAAAINDARTKADTAAEAEIGRASCRERV